MRIRWRLVVWHTGILASLLLVFTGGLFLTLNYHLNLEVNDSLEAWSDQVAATIKQGDSYLGQGRIGMNGHLTSRLSAPDSFAFTLDAGGGFAGEQPLGSSRIIQELARLQSTKRARPVETQATYTLAGQAYRVLFRDVDDSSGGKPIRLVVGRSLAHVQATLLNVGRFLIFAWVLAVAACLLVSWLFVGRTLKPVKLMTRDALTIADSGELQMRLADRRERDEFGALSQALNHMLTSLESSALRQKKFLADASHELRTPLTSIRANLDYLQHAAAAPAAERAEAFGDIVAQVNRMTGLVNELLALARAEAQPGLELVPVDLVLMTRETIAHQTFEPLGGRRFLLEAPAKLVIRGDADKVQQLLLIILDNACKYSPPVAAVSIALCARGHEAVLQVADEGPGIPPDELGLVFERFYRASNVRDGSPGSGLGLPIARTILQSMGGRIELSNRAPRGLLVKLIFPAV